MDALPPLIAKPPGRGLRTLGLVIPGVRRVAAQIEPYTEWWTEQNDAALRGEGPLWVVLGDSTCLGIGASRPADGWVGVVAERLRRRVPGLRVINLAMSGARTDDVLDTQLPILDELVSAGHEPDLVTLSAGSNDVFWSRTDIVALRDRIATMVERLPSPTVVATLAGSSQKAALANRALKQAVLDGGHHLVNPWNEPGPNVRDRVASDRFHPNDLGHRLMADAFARVIEPLV